MSASPNRRFLSIAEAADRIGVSTSTGYNLAAAGELPIVKLHGVRRVPASALERWLKDREDEALATVRD